jgi:hypothetical protein
VGGGAVLLGVEIEEAEGGQRQKDK